MATLSVGSDVHRATCKPGDYMPRIYSGTFNWNRLLDDEIPPGEAVFLLDIPLSFVLDTFVLPYTITTQLTWGNICPPPIKENENNHKQNL